MASPAEPVSLSHRVVVPLEPAATMRLVAETADAWGAEWSARGVAEGQLTLPVLAGLRRGWVKGTVRVDRQDEGTLVVYDLDESLYRIDTPAFVTLLIAAAGALVTLIAPFIPRLWPLVPAGIFLSLGAWLFIVARLRNSGPEEFLAELESPESEANPVVEDDSDSTTGE